MFHVISWFSTMPVNDDDADQFSALLGDDAAEIQRINVERRVALNKKADKDASNSARKSNAQAFQSSQSDPLDTNAMELVAPSAMLDFRRQGVQHGVYKNLRLGKYTIDAVLDLHGFTVEQARKELFDFVQDCMDNDIRSALITHGKGEGRETPALLKSCVAHWLPQIDEVLAFHTAQRHHGSYGSTYVLLRKSDKQKNKTKEELG